MPLIHVSFFKRQIHLHQVVIGRFILINSWWIDIVLLSLFQYTQLFYLLIESVWMFFLGFLGGFCHDVGTSSEDLYRAFVFLYSLWEQ